MSQRPNPTPPSPLVGVKDALKPGPLARPMDPTLMGHDSLAAKQLASMMNDPRLNIPLDTSKPLVKIDPSLAEETLTALNTPTPDLDNAPPVSSLSPGNLTTDQPEPRGASSASRVIFITGQPGTAIPELINGLKAQELPIGAGAQTMTNFLLTGNGLATLLPEAAGYRATVDTLRAWGDGEISEKYPLSPARFLFIRLVRSEGLSAEEGSPESTWVDFGNSNFWLRALLDQGAFSNNAVITGVNTLAAFKYLQENGVQHWHVMCNPATRNKREAVTAAASDPFITKLDQSVIAQVSKQKTGPKLHCVWNDFGGAPPSQRIYTVAQFLAERATAVAANNIEEQLPVSGE